MLRVKGIRVKGNVIRVFVNRELEEIGCHREVRNHGMRHGLLR